VSGLVVVVERSLPTEHASGCPPFEEADCSRSQIQSLEKHRRGRAGDSSAEDPQQRPEDWNQPDPFWGQFRFVIAMRRWFANIQAQSLAPEFQNFAWL
jgi:hypothetical protein